MASLDSAVKKAFQETGFPIEYTISPDPTWWDTNDTPTVHTVEVDGYEIVLLGELLEGFAEFSNHIAGAQQKINLSIRSAQLEILYDLIITFGFNGSEEAQFAFQYCTSGSLPKEPELLDLEKFNKAIGRVAKVEEYEDYRTRNNEQKASWSVALPIIEKNKSALLKFYIDNKSKFDAFLDNSQKLGGNRQGDIYQIAAFLRERCRFRFSSPIEVDIDHVMRHSRKTNDRILKLIENEIQGVDPKQAAVIEAIAGTNQTPDELLGNSNGSKKRGRTTPEETEPQLTTSLLQVA
jgi:hypothetical protein